MGCLGTGAVMAGLMIGRIRARLGPGKRLVSGAAALLFAVVMAVAALLAHTLR